MAKQYAFGLDLGTGYSAISVSENGQAKILVNRNGQRTTPSVVASTKEGFIVGSPASQQKVTNPLNTIYLIKRFMGKRFEEIPEEDRTLGYKVVKMESGLLGVDIDGKIYTPQEISAKILSELLSVAEDYVGAKLTKDNSIFVITCPAHWSADRKESIMDAAKIAGINCQKVIPEPTAAILAHSEGNTQKQSKIVVADFGSGTLDYSAASIGSGVVEIVAVSGDNRLGGSNLDDKIANYICDQFKNKEGIDLRSDSQALSRVLEASDRAKCELSNSMQTDINIPFITANASGPKHLQMRLTRTKFEQICEKEFNRCITPAREILEKTGWKLQEISEIVLVGGSSRIPRFKQIMKQIFGKQPVCKVSPDQAVSIGATLSASVLTGDKTDLLLLDILPISLSIQTMGGIATKMISEGTTIPTEKEQVYSTAADDQESVSLVICQGERQFVKDNITLGRFDLTGIKKAPRGVPQIAVKFAVDSNGILTVSAKDKDSGKQQTITISGSTKLSKEDIERMKNQADLAKEEDSKKKEFVEAKNQVENTIYQVDKFSEENKDKLSEQQKKSLDEAKVKVIEAQNKEEKDALVSASSELFALFMGIQQELNKSEVPSDVQTENKAE